MTFKVNHGLLEFILFLTVSVKTQILTAHCAVLSLDEIY
jgi:hypothetical protein